MKKQIKKIFDYFLNFEFIRFGIVGVLYTLVDFGLLNILMFSFKINSGSWFIVLRSFTFMVGVLVSFNFNKDWTFRGDKKEQKLKLIKFIFVSLITLLINNSITGRLIPFNFLILNGYLWANICTLLGAIVAIIARYFLSKYLIFK